MPQDEKKIGQTELRQTFEAAAGVTEDGINDVTKGVGAIRLLIESGQIPKTKARALFAYYAEQGYSLEDGWAMLASLPSGRAGKSKLSIGDKVDRKLHAGKNGRKGLYIPMGPYGESDEVRITYSKNQVLIKGIEPDDQAEA
jgi:hypothetical protein